MRLSFKHLLCLSACLALLLPAVLAQRRKTPLKAPAVKRDLYPTDADATADIQKALKQAAQEHKNVLLEFGANWCYDCHVLDNAFHDPQIQPLLDRNFVVVHVDVEEFNKNTGLARQYQVPLEKGIPALAVLDRKDKLLFSQKQGEFESARSLSVEDVLDFLNRWKPHS
ncbi:MAG TPA: thioredoxin family protein [Terriglobales bacterium]|nr:thioredoxin family protein [Terriglobales bacterium]